MHLLGLASYRKTQVTQPNYFKLVKLVQTGLSKVAFRLVCCCQTIFVCNLICIIQFCLVLFNIGKYAYKYSSTIGQFRDLYLVPDANFHLWFISQLLHLALQSPYNTNLTTHSHWMQITPIWRLVLKLKVLNNWFLVVHEHELSKCALCWSFSKCVAQQILLGQSIMLLTHGLGDLHEKKCPLWSVLPSKFSLFSQCCCFHTMWVV